MCYILKCFGCALDFIQGFLTFVFACCLMLVLCIGISTAIIAGVAYGYHYSLAEFLTFTRHDVSVYVRRGQYKDDMNFRRSGDEDSLPLNREDYPDVPKDNPKPLSDTWSKVQDTRNYADNLSKYSELTRLEDKKTQSPQTVKSLFSTVLPTRTSSKEPEQPYIVMRKFNPIHAEMPSTTSTINSVDDFDNEETTKYKSKKKKGDKKKKIPDKNYDLIRYIPIRKLKVTTARTNDELYDVDEDHVVYKPV